MKLKMEDILFIFLFLFFFFLIIKIFSPFFYSILWAVLIFIVFNPFYKKFLKKIKKDKFYGLKIKLISIIFSFFAVLIIVIPVIYLLFTLSNQFLGFYKIAVNFIKTNPELLKIDSNNKIVISIYKLTKGFIDLSNVNLQQEIIKNIKNISTFFLNNTTAIVKNIATFFISFLFTIFTLYFLFVDGEYLKDIFFKALPIDKNYTEILVKKFNETAYVVIVGYFIVAIVQGIIATILFLIFGIKNAVLWGSVLFFSSFIPILGATAVWAPISIYIMIFVSLPKGILLFIFAGFFISTIDNFLRPLIIKDKIKIHPLLIFFSILGALKFLGFSGIILGPIILILFFTIIDIFIDLFEHKQKKEDKNVLI